MEKKLEKYNILKKKIAVIILLVMFIMNLACYKFLPDYVGFHFDLTGDTNGSIPKLLFAFIMPLIAAACYFFYKIAKNASETKATLVCALIGIINVVLLFINLI